jgi:hypothetical protein
VKFKIGDRVRRIDGLESKTHKMFIGSIYKVQELYQGDIGICTSGFPDTVTWWHEENFELVGIRFYRNPVKAKLP